MNFTRRFSARRLLASTFPATLACASVAACSRAAAPVAATPTRPAAVRIVSCEAKVQSRKRGICANRLEAADFSALSPGVSWWYNWNYTTTDPKPAAAPMQFYPMVWGDRPQDVAGLEAFLAAGHRPRQILAINEPNLRGQAYITPEQTARLYDRVAAVAARYHIPVVGPQMALGSAIDASITAFDPLDNKQTTYTFMVPFEKAFLHFATKTPVTATSLHTYGSVEELRWATDLMHKEFHRPVWVTEYAHVPDATQGMTYLMQATDFLERTPYVEGYAWFKERADDPFGSKSVLLAKDPGTLTALGAAYVAMPVHDADLYYRIPGRLQAENYVTLDRAEIFPTTDTDGFAQMTASDAGATLDYNIAVDKAGTYTLLARVSGEPGSITILKGDTVVATVPAATARDGWQTITTSVTLPAGTQTLRLRLAAKGQTVNWVEFTRR